MNSELTIFQNARLTGTPQIIRRHNCFTIVWPDSRQNNIVDQERTESALEKAGFAWDEMNVWDRIENFS